MKFDVIVVGAGPAGSTAAKFLAEKGIKVLLIDKEKFPRDKPCGGALTLRVLKRFPYVKEENLVESYSEGGIAYSTSLKYKVKIQKNRPYIPMVVREKFDMGLVQLAIDSGAEFIDGRTVKDMKISKEKTRITLDKQSEVDSELVIGADGVWSIIAKKSGLLPKKSNVGSCIFQEYHLDEGIIESLFGKEKMCHVFIKFGDIPGYGWVFPKKQHLNIGIGNLLPKIYMSNPKMNLLKFYKNYIMILKKNKIIPENLEVSRYRGGHLRIGMHKKTYGNRVLLLGDAAGFVNPISGEGIYYAMSSGEIAANVVTEALEAGDTTEKLLSKYQVNWKKDFSRELKMLLVAYKVVWRASLERYVKLATIDKRFADLTIGMLFEGPDIREYKWKLLTRYLCANIKDFFGLVGS